jgi:hypothetical protein
MHAPAADLVAEVDHRCRPRAIENSREVGTYVEPCSESSSANALNLLATPTGFEPVTLRLGI